MTTLSRPEAEERPDLIPDGTYEARFLKIVEAENKDKPNPAFPDAKVWPTKYSWHFEITQPNEQWGNPDTDEMEDGNWFGRLFKKKTNPTVANEKATGYQILEAIIKRALLKGEQLDDTAFAGFPCALEISSYEDSDGVKWNYVKNVVRSRQGKMLPLPKWATAQLPNNAPGKEKPSLALAMHTTAPATASNEEDDVPF